MLSFFFHFQISTSVPMPMTAMEMLLALTFMGHTCAFAKLGTVATGRIAQILMSVPQTLTIATSITPVSIMMDLLVAPVAQATLGLEWVVQKHFISCSVVLFKHKYLTQF